MVIREFNFDGEIVERDSDVFTVSKRRDILKWYGYGIKMNGEDIHIFDVCDLLNDQRNMIIRLRKENMFLKKELCRKE